MRTSALSSIIFFTTAILFLSCFPYVRSQGTIGPSTHPAVVTADSIQKITNLSNVMYNMWSNYDAACDPKAVFAVAYLYMTANAVNLVTNNYFDDGNKMVQFIETFAGRFLAATDAWESGQTSKVSAPWTVYFEFLETDHSDVTQDVTMGMNAHINYDLSIAAYEEGYANPTWTNDYYRVNDLMAMVDIDVTRALGRYDPQFDDTDWVHDTYDNVSIAMVTEWRTNAYATCLLYQTASLTAPLPTVNAEMAANEIVATTIATAIAIPYPYSTAPSRIAYCEAHHGPLQV